MDQDLESSLLQIAIFGNVDIYQARMAGRYAGT